MGGWARAMAKYRGLSAASVERTVVLGGERSSFGRCPHLRIEIWGTRIYGSGMVHDGAVSGFGRNDGGFRLGEENSNGMGGVLGKMRCTISSISSLTEG
jgi:hypothetical protein